MRILKVPESGPKRKLLDATELLVTENGFDKVSVRDITGAIQANVAAVNYHFGSREGLMDLVMVRLLEPLCEERANALEQAGADASLSDIVSAFVTALPATAARLGMDKAFFLKLTGRILVLADDKLAPMLATVRAGAGEKYLAALTRALPDTNSGELAAGWRFFDSGLSQSLVTLTTGDGADELLGHWIAFGARGLGGGKSAGGVAKDKPKDDDAQGLLFDF